MQTKHSLWQQRIEHQKNSGKSIKQFCIDEGINRHVFQYWANKFKSTVSEATLDVPSVDFVPIEIKHDNIHLQSGFTLSHPSGFQIFVNRNTDFSLLQTLLLGMRGYPSC